MKTRTRVLAFGLLLAALGAVGGCKRSGSTATQGHELFMNACARCHGAEGAGGLAPWEGGPSPRNFRDHSFQMSRTDNQLKQTIKSGKRIGMPAFGTMLDDEQIGGLVLQIRSFDAEKNR